MSPRVEDRDDEHDGKSRHQRCSTAATGPNGSGHFNGRGMALASAPTTPSGGKRFSSRLSTKYQPLLSLIAAVLAKNRFI